MKTFIINLAKETDRKVFQQKEMEKHCLDYEFITAFQLSNLTDTEHAKSGYDWQRPLRKVEVCCLRSHIQAWERVVEQNSPALILEDDAYLCMGISSILRAIENTSSYDFVSLETRGKRKLISKSAQQLHADYKLHRLIQGGRGAAAYILHPNGAKTLIDFIKKKGYGITDAILEDCPNLIKGQIMPSPCLQLDMCHQYNLAQPLKTQTSIASQPHPKPKPRSVPEYLWMKKKRIVAQFKSIIRLICYRSFNTFILPPINKKDFS